MNPISVPPNEPLAGDLAECLRQFDEIENDAKRLLAGLNDAQLNWSPVLGRWSIAQCLDHLDITGRAHLPNMDETIDRARSAQWYSRGPFRYGFIERMFVRSTEPPPRLKVKAPKGARPSPDRPLARLSADFMALQEELRMRVRRSDGLDLARAKVQSPFIKALQFGLGPCLAFLAAHERRHLWQAWRVRNDVNFPRVETTAAADD